MIKLSEAINNVMEHHNYKEWNTIVPALKEKYYDEFMKDEGYSEADLFAEEWLSKPGNTKGFTLSIDNKNEESPINVEFQGFYEELGEEYNPNCGLTEDDWYDKKRAEVDEQLNKRYLSELLPHLDNRFSNIDGHDYICWIQNVLAEEKEITFDDEGNIIDEEYWD